MRGVPCDPMFWWCFNYRNTAKSSKYRELLINAHVNFSVPGNTTNRYLIERISRESRIPIDSVAEELTKPLGPGSRVIFGFAGDVIDAVAHNYENMQWWLSEAGLVIAVVIPTGSPHVPTFDELMADAYYTPVLPMAPERRSEGGPGRMDVWQRVPIHDALKQAEARTADPKLRKELTAVIRYDRFAADLKRLKVSCKRYQTPALLEQQYSELDVWAVMDSNDKTDVAQGNFHPGHFAWSLVKRQIKLSGKGDRTLKNYRKSLRIAGLI